LLRRYGGIISGSVALHFLFPDARWEPNDLDLYLPEGQINAFMKAVTDKDGLNFSPFNPKWVLGDPDELPPNFHWIPSSHAGLREVRQLYTPEGRRVDIIAAASSNPVYGLQRFWTSLVKNFLLPDACVCGFP
ncbi:hypothetical protein L226DRAFT_425045, partial [Lentinus tigrinus ALCF2SS1-7]